ncbi:hypothetical protein J0H58_23825 [bacterium]|nr:hypothetical protein [bacterium]
MAFTVSAGPSGRSILVRHSRDFDTATARAAAAAVEAFRQASPPLREAGVVCDVRGARNVSGLGRNYLFVWHDLPSVGATRTRRVALVRDPGDLSHDFVVAHLNGAGYDAEVFTDPGAAAEWVEAGSRGVTCRCHELVG